MPKTKKTKAIKKSAPAVKEKPKFKDRNAVVEIKTSCTWQTLKGFKDILPADQKYYAFLKKKMIALSNAYDYKRIDTPILEDTGLFSKGTGKNTDIVEKEMFSFSDKGGDNITVRPELTPSVVRAYLQHGMINQPQPVKLNYFGSAFRRENPQSGRLREFHQVGWEVIGEKHPAVDAELILMGYKLLTDLGLQPEVMVNSLGCAACRDTYKNKLVAYYQTKNKQLCLDCKKRLTKNPLRLLDCKEEQCQTLKAEAPQTVDWLCEECKNHLTKVLEYLDSLQINYSLNPLIVRGLDYYTRTVWEYWPAQESVKAGQVLGGGGRYDNLVEDLGGRAIPAIGLSMGAERIVTQLKDKGINPPEPYQPEIFIAQLGDAAKLKAMNLFEQLREQGFKLSAAFYKDSLRQQLELANKAGVKYTLILGQQEMADQTILIREMESGTQEVVDFKKVVNEIRKKLEKQQIIIQQKIEKGVSHG